MAYFKESHILNYYRDYIKKININLFRVVNSHFYVVLRYILIYELLAKFN